MVSYRNGNKNKGIVNLALDRIISIDYDFTTRYSNYEFDADEFYKDVVGVTVNQGERASNIKLWIDRYNARYA